MTSKYVAPDRSLSAFHCPFCGVYAAMKWGGMYEAPFFNTGQNPAPATATQHNGMHSSQNALPVCLGLEHARCTHCTRITLWYVKDLIYPPILAIGPAPVADMPKSIKDDFEEARAIAARSQRGAAALLRLCIQKLCEHLGEKEGNLNQAIGNLVKKGLDAEIVKALDTVRVIGAEAVHPLTMDLRDDLPTVERLFDLVNYVVDAMITQPRKRAALFGALPADKVRGIESRDRAKKSSA